MSPLTVMPSLPQRTMRYQSSAAKPSIVRHWGVSTSQGRCPTLRVASRLKKAPATKVLPCILYSSTTKSLGVLFQHPRQHRQWANLNTHDLKDSSSRRDWTLSLLQDLSHHYVEGLFEHTATVNCAPLQQHTCKNSVTAWSAASTGRRLPSMPKVAAVTGRMLPASSRNCCR